MLEHGRHAIHDPFDAFAGRDAGLDACGREVGDPESREDGQRPDDDSPYSFHDGSFLLFSFVEVRFEFGFEPLVQRLPAGDPRAVRAGPGLGVVAVGLRRVLRGREGRDGGHAVRRDVDAEWLAVGHERGHEPAGAAVDVDPFAGTGLVRPGGADGGPCHRSPSGSSWLGSNARLVASMSMPDSSSPAVPLTMRRAPLCALRPMFSE